MSQGNILYPSVTSLPGQSGIGSADRSVRKREGASGEFDQVFEEKLKVPTSTNDLDQIRAPLKFSAHASQRLRDRKIQLDSGTLAKVSDAVDRADAKGVEDTLILTSDAALSVNVKNRTVITAIDRNSASGNVFTNIDGAVVV